MQIQISSIHLQFNFEQLRIICRKTFYVLIRANINIKLYKISQIIIDPIRIINIVNVIDKN